MSYSSLRFEQRDDIVQITVNRPDKLNVLNHTVIHELGEAVTVIAEDRSIRAVILTGAGAKAFVAGADIGELSACNALEAQTLSQTGSGVFRRLELLPKPVLAAVNGFALGGGCELALACHIRIAAENAKFGQPEVKLGITPGYGGTVRLPRLVGRGAALALLLTGASIDAAEALRLGLVSRVVPPERLMAESELLLRGILDQGPLAVAECIRLVDEQEALPLDQALALESRRFGELAASEDFREGTAAFLAKRQAVFRGR